MSQGLTANQPIFHRCPAAERLGTMCRCVGGCCLCQDAVFAAWVTWVASYSNSILFLKHGSKRGLYCYAASWAFLAEYNVFEGIHAHVFAYFNVYKIDCMYYILIVVVSVHTCLYAHNITTSWSYLNYACWLCRSTGGLEH